MTAKKEIVRVLLVEDNPLDEEIIDAIISNYQLPAFSGSGALSIVQGRSCDVPIIVVSGAIGFALVHERLYRCGDMAEIDLAGYIKDLVENIRTSYGYVESAVNIRLDLDAVTLGLDKAVPCGLIVNELLTNSFKYAFPGGHITHPEIGIRLNERGGNIMIDIRDNGVGFHEPEEPSLTEHHTLGTELVRLLLLQIGGTVSLESNSGTRYAIGFPKTDKDTGSEVPGVK